MFNNLQQVCYNRNGREILALFLLFPFPLWAESAQKECGQPGGFCTLIIPVFASMQVSVSDDLR